VALLLLVPGLGGGARAGEIEAVVRYYFADRSFPADSFSAATHPSAGAYKTQLRLTGRQALWDGFLADYDLRYGFATRTDTGGGMRTVHTSNGPEDQVIGIRHALGEYDGISQAVRFSVVAPAGPGNAVPALGSGQWAIEPTYFIGFDPGLWNLHIGFDIGARTFLDGASSQIRTHLQVRMPVTPRLELAAEVSFRRSLLFAAYRPARDSQEPSNILRPGIEARYRLADGLESVLAYQVYAAGMDERAYQRLIVGLAFAY
jgi:hypothetical protein